jgi:methyl-accepting chemotaxis protein
MGLRDRFYTPQTAKAIMSWRVAFGLGAGVALGIAGLPIAVAVAGGAALYAGLVAIAMPKPRRRAPIDPFVLSEPWRQLVRNAQGAARKLRETVEATSDGPLKQTLRDIADQLERGLDEAWEIAKRGDEIDDAVRRLGPTALRSKLATLQQRAESDPSPETDAAVASVERQLEAADRLQRQSDETAASLRLSQTQLDELVARAAEVRVGAADTASYARDVDDLVIKLEALHQAVEETSTP